MRCLMGIRILRLVGVLGVTKSRIASGGVINRTGKSIHRTDIIGMRRRITQPGCPHFRRIAEGIAAVLTPSGPFFMSTRDDWKQCPLLARADMPTCAAHVRLGGKADIA